MIEPLEARIAPAAVFFTYTDLDGDSVRITATKAGAAVAPLDATDLTFVGGGTAGQLAKLDLTAPTFDGAKIVFTVTKKPGGDGLAHVGFIDAISVDLDQVIVKGDLGKIVVGDLVTGVDTGLNLLSVRSLGTHGLVTGAPDLESTIRGKLGALKVVGDVTDASLATNSGGIGSLFIGGDLTGGTATNSGRILGGGAIGPVRIVGDVRGGSGEDSGLVFAGSTMGVVSIGGDVIGGAGQGSGRIESATAMGVVTVSGDIVGGAGADSGWVFSSGTMGNVKIAGSITGGAGAKSGVNDALGNRGSVSLGGNLTGGTGAESGRIISAFSMGNVRIGGSVIGTSVTSGAGMGSGVISATADLGNVSIGGDLIGASAAGSATVFNSGSIFGRHIASVTLGGSIVAGSDASTGSVQYSGAIIATADLGPVKIGGSIVGNEAVPVFILAKGQAVKPTTGFDTAIASISVKGDVRFAQIRAGFDFNLNTVNADASIGAVAVGGDWAASSLVAGAQDAGAPGFGLGDTLQTFGDTSLVARIASIAIKGDVAGSLAAGDHHGFVAQQIGSFKSFGFIAPLLAATANQNIAIPFTNDVRILEV